MEFGPFIQHTINLFFLNLCGNYKVEVQVEARTQFFASLIHTHTHTHTQNIIFSLAVPTFIIPHHPTDCFHMLKTWGKLKEVSVHSNSCITHALSITTSHFEIHF